VLYFNAYYLHKFPPLFATFGFVPLSALIIDLESLGRAQALLLFSGIIKLQVCLSATNSAKAG